jgi:hypothetical protein
MTMAAETAHWSQRQKISRLALLAVLYRRFGQPALALTR